MLLVLCLMMQAEIKAQHIVARPFSFFYQLYSNEVFDIYQDRTGYLWFGMTSGLARYDGYRLHTFRSDYAYPKLLVSNNIIYMTDNDRYLWVGTNNGVTLFDKQTWKTQKIEDKRIDGHVVNDVATNTATEEVWIAIGNHVYRCSPDGKQITAYKLQKNALDEGFRQLYVDHDNRIWAMSHYGLFGYDKVKDIFVKYPAMPNSATPYTMLQDKQGNYWIGTWGEGLWQFNPKVKSADCYQRQVVKITGSEAEDRVFFSMVQDDTFGYLWMLSYNELHAMKYEDRKLIPVDISQIMDPHKMFTKILKDREGNLWIGSYDMGYTIYFDRSGTVSHPLAQLKSLIHHDANIVNLGYDGDGVLWMGQDRYGLLLYDLKSGNVISESHLGLGEIALMKRSRSGGMWLRMRNKNRIVKTSRIGMSVKLAEDIKLDEVLANAGDIIDMNEDDKGNLWILTTKNLYVHKPHTATIYSAGKEVLRPDAFAVDAKGKVWAVKNKRAYRLSFDGRDVVSRYVAHVGLLQEDEVPLHLCVDKRGALWLSTSLSRIVRSDVTKTKFFNQTTDQLDDGTLLSIQSYGNKVWAMTNKKLLSIDILTHKEMTYEANSENISVKAFRSSALCPDLQGGVFAGGHDGIVHVKHEPGPQLLPHNFRFQVSDVLSNGHSMMFDNPDKDSRDGLVYLPADSRNIEICVTSLLFSPDAMEKVQYKLEGVDPDWVDLDKQKSSAFYSYLPRGKHRFMVRWQKDDGTWTEAEGILLLVRIPAFYETTMAFILYGLLLLLMVYYLVYVIRRRANMSALRHYHNQVRIERLMEKSATEASVAVSSGTDNVFVKKMMDLIETHISDSEYGQEQLAQDLLLSRSTLYRKIKLMTGMAPLDFIRNVKMKKACVMLSQHELSISEIAYSLGFSNPKYFTKCFKEEMGQTPSEYQKTH